MAVEKPQSDEAATDVVSGMIDKGRFVAASEVVEELVAFGVNTAIADSAAVSVVREELTFYEVNTTVAESEEKHPAAIEQETVEETAPFADIPSTRVDEAGPSETAAPPTAESVPLPPSKPRRHSFFFESNFGTSVFWFS